MDDARDNKTSPPPSKRLERLQIMLTEEEQVALDTWRFRTRMPSRSAAVRELIRRGLAAEGFFDEAGQNKLSSSFGILGDETDA